MVETAKETEPDDDSTSLILNEDAKSGAEEGRLSDEEEDRKRIVVGLGDTLVHLDGAHTYEGGDTTTKKQNQRRRYQFEETASDEEVDDELDPNLDEIADIMKKFKAADKQNTVPPELERKTIVFSDPISRSSNGDRVCSILIMLFLSAPHSPLSAQEDQVNVYFSLKVPTCREFEMVVLSRKKTVSDAMRSDENESGHQL